MFSPYISFWGIPFLASIQNARHCVKLSILKLYY
jgi:hypothetical protein